MITNTKKNCRFTQKSNGNNSRKQSTLLKQICCSSFFGCHPRRMLRIKSNCRFLLLAVLTLSTLMLLFTVTEFDHQNSPVIQDTIYEIKDEIEDVKKNLHVGNSFPKKRNGEETLRVDKKHLLNLGLPAYPDDINIEVFFKTFRSIMS